MNAIRDWFLRPARWWQFWRPQSGALGGMLAAAIFILLPIIILAHLIAPGAGR